jgi:hypothetical protein
VILEREYQLIVYVLIDPRDKSIRYIGSATRLGRILDHWRARGDSAKAKWVAELKAAGLACYDHEIVARPRSFDMMALTEKALLKRARAEGWPIVNATRDTGSARTKMNSLIRSTFLSRRAHETAMIRSSRSIRLSLPGKSGAKK